MKAFAIFTAVTLLAWLLPLGAFIGASQERTACGGKRAFHMCHSVKGEVRAESSSTVAFSSAGSHETSKASGAASDDLVLAAQAPTAERSTRATASRPFRSPEDPSFPPLGPPPKASFSF